MPRRKAHHRPSATRVRRRAVQKLVADLPVDLEPMPLEELEEVKRPGLVGAWRSRHFIVQHWCDELGERLSITRIEEAWLGAPPRSRAIPWETILRLKRQAGLGDRWAAEVFPPDSQGDEFNRTGLHLWLFLDPPAFMFDQVPAAKVETAIDDQPGP